MRATEAYGELQRIGRPIISTREAAARLGVSIPRASNLLKSFAEDGIAQRLRRGLWCLDSSVDSFRLAPYLTAPDPAYVSFWSALSRHGMIEQIPRQVFVASLHASETMTTTVGSYVIHQLAPALFDGYEGTEEKGYIAIPEKALFDTIYLRAPSGGRIYLPELTLPLGFDALRLDEWTSRVSRKGLRTLVASGIEATLARAAPSDE